MKKTRGPTTAIPPTPPSTVLAKLVSCRVVAGPRVDDGDGVLVVRGVAADAADVFLDGNGALGGAVAPLERVVFGDGAVPDDAVAEALESAPAELLEQDHVAGRAVGGVDAVARADDQPAVDFEPVGGGEVGADERRPSGAEVEVPQVVMPRVLVVLGEVEPILEDGDEAVGAVHEPRRRGAGLDGVGVVAAEVERVPVRIKPPHGGNGLGAVDEDLAWCGGPGGQAEKLRAAGPLGGAGVERSVPVERRIGRARRPLKSPARNRRCGGGRQAC